MRSWPDSADKALAAGAADQGQSDLPRQIDAQAVKPERDTRIGIPIRTVLMTISGRQASRV